MSDVSLTQKPVVIPTVNDSIVGVTADGTVKLFTVGSLPASGSTPEELAAVRDDAVASAVALADAAADAGDSATLAAANAHADAGDAATLTAANAYADTVAAGGGVSEATVDSKDAATLSSANSHADSAAAAAQSAAEAYADAGDSATLSAANAYADSVTVGGSYVPGGTGSTSRPINTKVKEVEVSVLDYGADPTGVADSTTAFANAIASGAYRIHVPTGTYKVTKLVVNKYVTIYGDGRTRSIVKITTTTDHGIDVLGDSAYYANGDDSNVIRFERIQFKYTGTGQAADKHGMICRVKTITDEVFVNGFTHSGIITDTWQGDTFSSDAGINPGDNQKSPFFMEFRNTWSKNCGDYGMEIRFGANVTQIINCNLDKNGINGLYHHTGNGLTGTRFQPSATYGTIVIGGQASYNGYQGYNFASGTNVFAAGIYMEGNGRGTGTVAHTTTQFDISINVSLSTIMIGVVPSPNSAHIEIVDPNDRTLLVTVGGVQYTARSGSISRLASTATLAQVITKVNQVMDNLAQAKVTAG